MPIQKLKKSDFENRPSRAGHPEYIEFLSGAQVGDGGRLLVEKEGVSRMQIKNRMKQAGKITGKKVKFYRSPATEVVFQVVE